SSVLRLLGGLLIDGIAHRPASRRADARLTRRAGAAGGAVRRTDRRYGSRQVHRPEGARATRRPDALHRRGGARAVRRRAGKGCGGRTLGYGGRAWWSG